jgi:hypothetical protein
MLDFLRTKNVDVRTYPEQRRRRKKMTNVFYMELNDLNYELERSAEILRVLAHPVRLQIVHQLLGLTPYHFGKIVRLDTIRTHF